MKKNIIIRLYFPSKKVVSILHVKFPAELMTLNYMSLINAPFIVGEEGCDMNMR